MDAQIVQMYLRGCAVGVQQFACYCCSHITASDVYTFLIAENFKYNLGVYPLYIAVKSLKIRACYIKRNTETLIFTLQKSGCQKLTHNAFWYM